MKPINLFVFSMFLVCFMSFGQTQQNKAFYQGHISSVEYVSPMASRPNDLIPATDSAVEAKDKRSLGNSVVSGKDPQTTDDYFFLNKSLKKQSFQMKEPSLVFDTYSSSAQPTDPSLAVGPDHVFVVYNTGFMIYDKNGNQLQGQTAPNPAIFPSGGCCDLTVSYDNAADRWVLSFLSRNNGAQIAISEGSNPLTSGWYVYNISAISDYQKLSVWSDGYYITDNTRGSNKVWALEREAMLNGDSDAQIVGFNLPGLVTSGFYSPQALNITDDNLPAAGGATIVYLQDNAWSGVSTDHIKIWTIDVDWNNTNNSSISSPSEINTTPFIGVFDGGSFSNLSQPGGGATIDALQATIMNQAQFRKFPAHNSAIFNFVVDVDASSGKRAGVRWYEFRQSGDNQPWSLYQEGTYTAPDGRHAWNASMAMDGQGNIGMGYTSMSGPSTPSTVRVSSYYTGRLSSDELGVMTGSEQLISNGNGNIPSLRYGDYSKIDVDPSDDSSFWFITEYVNNGRKGVVGKFQIGDGDDGGDDGVIAAYYFETDLEGWIDGGGDCTRRQNSTAAFEGDYSIRLRDNSSSSNAVSPVLDLTGNSEVSIEFHTYAISMENGEDYFVEFFNGSSYEVIGQYTAGTDFTNRSFFTDTIVLDASEYNFNTSNRFRIRCDASNNNDRVFFDQIIISGDNVRATTKSPVEESDHGSALKSFTSKSLNNINLHPNPTNTVLNIEITEGDFEEIIIFSSTGMVVNQITSKTNQHTINVSELASGMYFVRFVSENGLAVTKRFIKN